MNIRAKSDQGLRRPFGLEMQWYFVGLVTLAIAISYFDRQTLPVAISAIQQTIPLSDQQFSWLQTAFLLSYAALYIGGGRLLDRLGTRRGFIIIMLWWSLACALHGLAMSFGFLLAARFLLGMGEGGAFPAAVRVVAEWIPQHQRSTAVGIINAGTAVGSVLAPPLIGVVLLTSGWRMVFFAAGAVGIAWVLWWASAYRSSAAVSMATLDARLIAQELSFRDLLGLRSVRVIVFAKFMSDSAWYFLSLLVAEVSLRCARLRCEAGELLRMDSVCRVWRRKFSGRMVFQLPDQPGALAGLLSQICSWP